MKQNNRAFIAALLALAMLLGTAGCAATENPYRANDESGYHVSVKYDANGGFFTTNTSVIVDSYNLADLPKDSNGDVKIPLLEPNHPNRGKEAFTAVKNGYFLAGWYAQRTGEGENVTYADQWEFAEDVLTVKADGTYTAAEPVLTLYAAWVPLFEFEIYDLNSGSKVGSAAFAPQATGTGTPLPGWDEKTGAMLMGMFPEYEGHTWGDVYLDAEGTQKVTSDSIHHTGIINYENATVENGVMKLYVDYMEGEWYRITSAKQFASNASVSGNYILESDLDFNDQIWPTVLMHGNFTGTIQGNGHTIRNIHLTQTSNSKVNTGLFGQLTEEAAINGVTFENATLTIQGGTRVPGASFGLLAGVVSDDAELTDVSVSGEVQIDTKAFFATEDYEIGLLCGMGEPDVENTGITCKVVGDNAESLAVSVEDGKVILSAAE